MIKFAKCDKCGKVALGGTAGASEPVCIECGSSTYGIEPELARRIWLNAYCLINPDSEHCQNLPELDMAEQMIAAIVAQRVQKEE